MVEEELDETSYWIELLVDSGLMSENQMRNLHNECIELLKITISSITETREYLNAHPDEQ